MTIYTHTGNYSHNVDMLTFIRHAKQSHSGAVPILNSNIPCITLMTGESGFLHISGKKEKSLKVVGMMTCASLIILSTAPKMQAFVYHVPSGSLRDFDFPSIWKIMNDPKPENLYAIYAHPDDSDKHYKAAVDSLITAKISSENVIEIENLATRCFGINSAGEIG